jgi:hypothetical protein
VVIVSVQSAMLIEAIGDNAPNAPASTVITASGSICGS